MKTRSGSWCIRPNPSFYSPWSWRPLYKSLVLVGWALAVLSHFGCSYLRGGEGKRKEPVWETEMGAAFHTRVFTPQASLVPGTHWASHPHVTVLGVYDLWWPLWQFSIFFTVSRKKHGVQGSVSPSSFWSTTCRVAAERPCLGRDFDTVQGGEGLRRGKCKHKH